MWLHQINRRHLFPLSTPDSRQPAKPLSLEFNLQTFTSNGKSMAADRFPVNRGGRSGCGLGAGCCIVAPKGATMLTSLPVFVSDVILSLRNVIPQRDGATNSMYILFHSSACECKHGACLLMCINVHSVTIGDFWSLTLKSARVCHDSFSVGNSCQRWRDLWVTAHFPTKAQYQRVCVKHKVHSLSQTDLWVFCWTNTLWSAAQHVFLYLWGATACMSVRLGFIRTGGSFPLHLSFWQTHLENTYPKSQTHQISMCYLGIKC